MKGADLKAEIKRQGKSLTEVAEALGMSQQNLNSALSGDNIKTGTGTQSLAWGIASTTASSSTRSRPSEG